MGQYHIVVNLDKKEFLHPHELGNGLKLWEFGGSGKGVMTAVAMLLAVSNGRGGGDFSESTMMGRWGGDRLAIVGDYAEETDLPPEYEAKAIYHHCMKDGKPSGGWKNITAAMRKLIEKNYQVRFIGKGWRARITEEEYKLRRLTGEKSIAS